MICPQCESYVSENMAFCPFCGYEINSALKKASKEPEQTEKKPRETVNFFGSSVITQNDEEDTDYGHISSVIQTPQLADTENFSQQMQSAFSSIIDKTIQPIRLSDDETPDDVQDDLSDLPDGFDSKPEQLIDITELFDDEPAADEDAAEEYMAEQPEIMPQTEEAADGSQDFAGSSDGFADSPDGFADGSQDFAENAPTETADNAQGIADITPYEAYEQSGESTGTQSDFAASTPIEPDEIEPTEQDGGEYTADHSGDTYAENADDEYGESDNDISSGRDRDDDFVFTRRYFPENEPIIDFSELPANKVYQQKMNGGEQYDEADIFQNNEAEQEEVFNLEFADEGPDLLGELRFKEDEEEPEYDSSFSLSKLFGSVKQKAGTVFAKKEKPQDSGKRDSGDRPTGGKKFSFPVKKQEKTPASGSSAAKAAKPFSIRRYFPHMIIGLLAVIFLVIIISVISCSSSSGGQKKLFPAVYYDKGKVVLLKSDRPEDKHNAASSGVGGTEDIYYYNDIGRIYYVKNNDLYCYSVKKLEEMRIVRNVYSFAFFDEGRYLAAVSGDGKVYFFNGKDITAVSKENDPIKSNSLPYVSGNNFESALYLDKYNSAADTAVIYRIDKSGKGKPVMEAPEATDNIELLSDSFIMLTDGSGNGMLYDISGSPIGEFEQYEQTSRLGKDSLLIKYKSGTWAVVTPKSINDVAGEVAEIIDISDESDKFCYKTTDGMCYAYDNGKVYEVGDISGCTRFKCDIEGSIAYALENDILTVYNIGRKVKTSEICDGVSDVARDEVSGIWLARTESDILRLNGASYELICTGSSYPAISSDGKQYLYISDTAELVLINGGREQTVAQDVIAFDYDSSFKNILFVSEDKIYLNQKSNRVTTVRDTQSFEFCQAE